MWKACVLLMLFSVALCDDSYWCDDPQRLETLSSSLNALYLSTEETSWTHSHFWGTSECPCTWYGVDCVSDGNSTVRLNLDGNGVYGTIPNDFCADIYSLINLENNLFFSTLNSCIGDLSQLESLKLSNNTFQGLIPQELENLSQLKTLAIADNDFAGPFPDYLECPSSFFKSSVKVTLQDNQFWCPVPVWCSDDEESCNCVDEPSDNCTLLNELACKDQLACCYASSWNESCDEFVANDADKVNCDDYQVMECPEDSSSSDSNMFWYLLIGGALLVCVLAGGWTVFIGMRFARKDWRLKDVISTMVKEDEDDSEWDDKDDDLYYDGVPPRSSLDLEL